MSGHDIVYDLQSLKGHFLERFYDPEFKLPRLPDKPAVTAREVKRLSDALALVFVVGSMKRRLGGEATREDLATDKKRAARVTHALRQSMISWIRKVPKIEVDEPTRLAGIQLDWTQFYSEHCNQLNTELRIVANWAIKHDEHRWGKSAIVNLENELRWISYSMRD